jgi:hypothetical protein
MFRLETSGRIASSKDKVGGLMLATWAKPAASND